MKTTAVEVDFRYSRDQLQAMFDLARAQDVEKRGRYDARSGAINIYTQCATRRCSGMREYLHPYLR